jgi:hypothetical protein
VEDCDPCAPICFNLDGAPSDHLKDAALHCAIPNAASNTQCNHSRDPASPSGHCQCIDIAALRSSLAKQDAPWTGSLRSWPGTESPSPSRSKRPTPASASIGGGTTASTGRHSSSSIARPAQLELSCDTQPASCSTPREATEISNIFGASVMKGDLILLSVCLETWPRTWRGLFLKGT